LILYVLCFLSAHTSTLTRARMRSSGCAGLQAPRGLPRPGRAPCRRLALRAILFSFFFSFFFPLFFFPPRGLPLPGRAFPCRDGLSPVSSERLPHTGCVSRNFDACGGRRLRRAVGTPSFQPTTSPTSRAPGCENPNALIFCSIRKFATTTWGPSPSLLQ
jgi:hypothetical protein